MPLTIHLGMPKTGTSSLQRALAGARERLAQAGILYPAGFGPRPGLAHHYIPQDLTAGADSPKQSEREFLGFLRVNKEKRVLISSEAFTNCLSPARLGRLVDFVSECAASHKVRCVIALRRIDAFMESMYLHSLKAGEIRETFSDYAERRRLWSAELVRALVELRKSTAVSELLFVKYRPGRDYEQEMLRELQVTGNGLDSFDMGSENARLGVKAQSFFGNMEAIEREFDAKFERWRLIRAFEKGEIKLKDDVTEYSVMSVEERAYFHELTLQAARDLAFPQYVDFFENESLTAPPQIELSRNCLKRRDIRKLMAFEAKSVRRARRKRRKPGPGGTRRPA